MPFIPFYRLEIKKKKELYRLPGKALYMAGDNRHRLYSDFFLCSSMGGLSREGLRF